MLAVIKKKGGDEEKEWSTRKHFTSLVSSPNATHFDMQPLDVFQKYPSLLANSKGQKLTSRMDSDL